jgi:hypothetical protein
MDITKVRDKINIEFENHVGANEIDNAINEVIETINRDIGGAVAIITITGISDSDWDEITTDWDSVDTDWDVLGRFTNNFTWDINNERLIIPENIILLKELYVDDEIWENQTYDRVKDTTYRTLHYYNHEQGSYHIYFPTNIADEDVVIKIKAEYNYSEIENNVIPIPDKYQQMLISGSILALAGRSRNVISDFALQRHINLYNTTKNQMIRLKYTFGGQSRRLNMW